MIKAIFFLMMFVVQSFFASSVARSSDCYSDFECFVQEGNFERAQQLFLESEQLRFALDGSMRDFETMNRAVRVMRFVTPWMKIKPQETLDFLKLMFAYDYKQTIKAFIETQHLEHLPWIYVLDQPYFKGQEDIIKLFIDQGLSVNQYIKIEFNGAFAYVTPLFLAYKNQNNQAKNLLFRLQANISAVQIIPMRKITYEKEYMKRSGEWQEIVFPVPVYKNAKIALKDYLILGYMLHHNLVLKDASQEQFDQEYNKIKIDPKRPYLGIPGYWTNDLDQINEILEVAVKHKLAK